MDWNFIEILNSFIEMGIIYLYFGKLMSVKPVNNAFILSVYLISSIILSFFSSFLNIPLLLLTVTFVLLFANALILYEDNRMNKIFYSFMYVVIILITDPVLVGISYISKVFAHNDLFENEAGRIVGMVITKVVYFWSSVALARILKKKVRELPLKYWISILLTPIISIILLYGMTIPMLEHENSKIILIYIISIFGIVYLNVSMFNFFDSYSKQIKLSFMETVAERENDNYQSLKLVYQEMKKLKHDFKNELETLNSLISERKYETAENHIAELSDYIDKTAAICYTGNEAVDSLINNKIRSAKQQNIKVITKMNTQAIPAVNSMELCRIFGNALDNAIEACCKIEESKRFICISIKELEDVILIEISNSSEYVDTSNLISTKVQKGIHGYGIQSICSSVARIGGTYNFKYNGSAFVFKMYIENTFSAESR